MDQQCHPYPLDNEWASDSVIGGTPFIEFKWWYTRQANSISSKNYS